MIKNSSIILNKQNENKITVSPIPINEMNNLYSQINMVSGAIGIIANNTELNLFSSKIENGLAPILLENNSISEIEQSTFTIKNEKVDNSKAVIGIHNNNILDDINTSVNGKITRSAAIDISNSVNFPAPSPGYIQSNKTVLENTANLIDYNNYNDPIAAAELVNNGINYEMGTLSGSILRKSYEIDLRKTHIDFYNKNIYNDYTLFNNFIKNLPRDLNGNILTIIFDTTFSGVINFDKFYGGLILIKGIYNGNLIFNQCQNITFDNFETNNSLSFIDCENVITKSGIFNKGLTIIRSKCHFIQSTFNNEPVITDNELANVLFDQCEIAGALCITSNGSHISSVNPINTYEKLLNNNFSSELIQSNIQNTEQTTNHMHISLEHINNETPIGLVYGWPRVYTRGDLTRIIKQLNENQQNNWQISVLPTISGLTSNYLSLGDLPLDMNGSYQNSCYANQAQSYNDVYNTLPISINTITDIKSFCIFDWYKLYNENNKSEQIIENPISSVTSSMLNDIKCNAWIDYNNKFINSILTDDDIYMQLESIDVQNIHARKRANVTLDININNKGFTVYTRNISGEGRGTTINYSICFSGLTKYIPQHLLKFVKLEYSEKVNNTYIQHHILYDETMPIQKYSVISKLGTDWKIYNILLYIPYISVYGTIEMACISLQDTFENNPSNYQYSKTYNERYDVNPGIIKPNIISKIKLTPFPRNIQNIMPDDWYLFSDTILIIKAENETRINTNNYRSKFELNTDFNNELIYKYYYSTINNISNFVHNIDNNNNLEEIPVSIANIKTKVADASIYQNGIAMPAANRFEINPKDNILIRIIDNQILNVNCDPAESVYNTYSTLQKSLMYNSTDLSFYKPNYTLANAIQPLTIRNINNTEINDASYNIYITENNTTDRVNIAPLTFSNELVHMIAKHLLMKSSCDFFESINGIAISENLYDFYDNSKTEEKTSINVSWPPDNYLNGFSTNAKDFFNSSVGAAYPMASGTLLSNIEIDILTNAGKLNLHQSENDQNTGYPFSTYTKTATPAYYGIPYLVTDAYGSISYGMDKNNMLSWKYCDTVFGGQNELSANAAIAMPLFNELSLNSLDESTSGYFINNNSLFKINNMYKIHNDLLNNNLSFPFYLKYNRDLIIDNIYITSYTLKFYGYQTITSSKNLISTSNNDPNEFKKACQDVATWINTHHDNSIIFIEFIDENNTNNFSRCYTNINNDNYIDIISIFNAASNNTSSEVKLEGSYDTIITFNHTWEWEIFYKHYMHKLYFAASKINELYYKAGFNNNDNKKSLVRNISFLNIINYAPNALFCGTNESILTSTFNPAGSNAPKNCVKACGQMYYPIGNTINDTYEYEENLISYIINYIKTNDNGNPVDISKDTLFYDKNDDLGKTGFSMSAILNNKYILRKNKNI